MFFQELEDQLQDEENKVNHLNKLKGKLEGEIDEVGERDLVVKKRRRCRVMCSVPDSKSRSGSNFYPLGFFLGQDDLFLIVSLNSGLYNGNRMCHVRDDPVMDYLQGIVTTPFIPRG